VSSTFKELFTSLIAWSRVLIETSYSTASQEIPRTLWKQKVYHRVHKSPPPVPVLSQTKPVQKHINSFTTHYHILSPKPASSKWSLSRKLSHLNPILTPPPHTTHSCQMSRPFYPSRFNYPNNTLKAMWIIKPGNRTEFITGISWLDDAFQIRHNSHRNLRTTCFPQVGSLASKTYPYQIQPVA
jgi:hypothetical protein